MNDLTDFQKRIIADLKRSPNQTSDWYEIAWNAFPERWNKKSARGALIRSIQLSCRALEKKGLIWILPPKSQHDAATYALRKKANT